MIFLMIFTKEGKKRKNGELILRKSLKEDQECCDKERVLLQITSHTMIKIAEIHV